MQTLKQIKEYIRRRNPLSLYYLSRRATKYYHHTKIEPWPDDVWIVSYPKSGNTWVRILIGNYLKDSNHNTVNLNSTSFRVTPIHKASPKSTYKELPRPRFFKSHFPLASYYPSTYTYPKVIYLVRDGRDVAVSYYFYCKKTYQISNNEPFADFLNKFNQGSIDRYNNWHNHIHSWLDHASPQMVLIKYEDLKINTLETFIKILEFVGIFVDEEKAKQAVEASTFEKLKSAEEKKILLSSHGDPNIPFFRRGEIGDWRNWFDEKLTSEFLAIHGSALQRLDYI